jgi:citrate lyase beta subunit
MPADSMRKITKATQIEVDSIIMDLEDAVALNQKEVARQTARAALQTLEFGRRERLVRLNAPVELLNADLQATIEGRPDGYVIPKAETAEQLQYVSRLLDEAERERGWGSDSVRLLAIIETARGVMNLRELAQASRRLEALMFGAEDLAVDIGATRTPAGWEVFYARSAVVMAAAAYELQAIDMVLVDLQDMARLEQECVVGRQMGYEGKMAIHPRQVEVINRVFAPSPAEIERARRLVQANAENQASGLGTFQFEGQMVDMPVVKAAERLLERARQAGLLDSIDFLHG